MKTVYLTPSGYEKMKQDYELFKEQRPGAVEHLKKARELGDLSENGYYKASRAKLSFIDGRLFYLKNMLKIAQVVQAEADGVAAIGCTVTIVSETYKKTYTIVGSYEANPDEGKVSHLSPIGKSLLGKKIGETIHIQAPSGVKTFTIEEVTVV